MHNLLLADLPPDELTRIIPVLEPVPIIRKTVIYKAGDIVNAVYFPSGGLVCEMATLNDGQGLEVISVGREGAFGITALFGLEVSLHELVVQISGAAWRVDIGVLKRLCESCPVLRDRIMRYLNASFLQAAQTALCSGRHTVSQRCANKLVDAHHRSGSASLPLTHENLAHALGVRRAGITNSMAVLERDGSIRCMRGSVEIVDIDQLHGAACDCSATNTNAYKRLFPRAEDTWTAPQPKMQASVNMVSFAGRA